MKVIKVITDSDSMSQRVEWSYYFVFKHKNHLDE